MLPNAALVQQSSANDTNYGDELDGGDALVTVHVAVQQGAGDENTDSTHTLRQCAGGGRG